MDQLESNVLRSYNLFLKNKEEFRYVYGNELSNDKNDILLVLDSSFNPPHLGHLFLVKSSIEHFKKHHENKNISLLLLLSVENADKPPTPASFYHRLLMICIFSDTLKEEGIKSSVCLTRYARFVDKSAAIRKHARINSDIVYLVGYDTIIRIFDPKYYKPDVPAVVLNNFMTNTQFCCLTRQDSLISKAEQLKYSDNILSGHYEPIIPASWGVRIHVLPNSNRYSSISSSKIRKLIQQNSSRDKLENDLPKSILKFLFDDEKSIYC